MKNYKETEKRSQNESFLQYGVQILTRTKILCELFDKRQTVTVLNTRHTHTFGLVLGPMEVGLTRNVLSWYPVLGFREREKKYIQMNIIIIVMIIQKRGKNNTH